MNRPTPSDPATGSTRPTEAVIGARVSGLTAAHVLSATHDVTLVETDDTGHLDVAPIPPERGGAAAVVG